MIALNIVLMSVVVLGLALELAWSIVSDRRSKRASGGPTHPADAPLDRNLVMPRELHRRSGADLHPKRRTRSASPTA